MNMLIATILWTIIKWIILTLCGLFILIWIITELSEMVNPFRWGFNPWRRRRTPKESKRKSDTNNASNK